VFDIRILLTKTFDYAYIDESEKKKKTSRLYKTENIPILKGGYVALHGVGYKKITLYCILLYCIVFYS